jgi:alpha-ketoglutarate-dependent taurine dioxygenase
MYPAYETLSEGMKKMLDGMQCVHMREEKLLDHSSPDAFEKSRRDKTIAQPVVMVHPENVLWPVQWKSCGWAGNFRDRPEAETHCSGLSRDGIYMAMV